MGRVNPSEHYLRMAVGVSAGVIGEYSTSFSLANRLLPRRARAHIASIYTLVRIADEIVDGACPEEPGRHLDRLEADTEDAIHSGFSANPVVHSFGYTARTCGFGTELTAPFFASMRADLAPLTHSPQSLATYIHGSAEVVGLMCLRVYLDGVAPQDYDELAPDAQRLGAAFQKINFLRDLADDESRLGRAYLPELTDQAYADALADARTDLAAGRAAIDRLPRDVQLGVRSATELYAELLQRLADAGLAGARARRIRVPSPAKALLVARAARPVRTWKRR